MHIVVDENPIAIKRATIKNIPELKSEYRIEFSFKMPEINDAGFKHVFQIKSHNGIHLAGMFIRQSEVKEKEYFKTKLFEIRSYGTKDGKEAINLPEALVKIIFGQWTRFSFVKRKDGYDLYSETKKLVSSTPPLSVVIPAASNVAVTSGADTTIEVIEESYLKNFYVYNKN